MMLRVASLMCAFLCFVVPLVPTNAQESIVVETFLDGNWCCTVYGQLGDEFKPFCCSHPDKAEACRCAEKFRDDAGYSPLPMLPDTEANCLDLECPKAPIPEHMSYRPIVKVRLKCCGCNGRVFYANGEGSTYCKALNQANRTAQVIGAQFYCGLRWSCICNPCAQPTKNCEPQPQKRFRIFR